MLLILIYHLVTIATATQSTSTITHLNESKALFLSKGELVLTNSFAHLICDFDLTQLHEHLTNLYTIRTQVSMINITENWPQAGASPAKREKLARRVAFVNNFINTTVLDISTKINSILESLNQPILDNAEHLVHQATLEELTNRLSPGRQKRQLITATIGLLAGTAGGFFSTLFSPNSLENIIQENQEVLTAKISSNAVRTLQNKKDILRIKKTVNTLYQALATMVNEKETLAVDTALIYATQLCSIVSHKLTEFTTTIHQARHGKLDLSAINGQQLSQNLQRLSRKVANAGYKLTTQNIEDLTAMETSTVIHNSTISVITHLPIFTVGERLELYSYVPTPLRATYESSTVEDPSPVWVTVKSVQPLLGINQDRTLFVTMSNDQLATCQNRQDIYFCPHLIRMKTGAPSCTHSLFRANHIGIQRHCRTEFTTFHHDIQRLAADTWLITTSQAIEMEISCPNTPPTKHQLQGSLIVKLGTGCIGNTLSFTISKPQYEADTQFKNSLITEVPDIRPLLDTAIRDVTEIKDEITLVGKPITEGEVRQATKFKDKIKQINNFLHPLSMNFNILSSAISTVTSILLTILILACTCYTGKKCYPRFRKQLQVPPADDQPPAEFPLLQQANQAANIPNDPAADDNESRPATPPPRMPLIPDRVIPQIQHILQQPPRD